MKVRCDRYISRFGREIERSSWVRIGEVYEVIELCAGGLNSENHVRLITMQETPVLFKLRAFSVVDDSLPSTWAVKIRSHSFTIGPRPWLDDAFWGRFFDREAEAIRIYEVECEKMGIDLRRVHVASNERFRAIQNKASSEDAFEAFREALYAIGNEERSSDVLTVALGMEYVNGRTADPAMQFEWKERWGDSETLALADALHVGIRFLEFEVGWSDDLIVHELLAQDGNDSASTRLRDVFYCKLKQHA